MALLAFFLTGGRFGADATADLVLWGSAAAAAVAAMVVAIGGSPYIGWTAIGYILFAGLLALGRPQLVVLSLAVALMPVMQRPRGSLLLGLAVAALGALLVDSVLAAI
ncbi:MAG TPA: hypothetical protein VFM93_04585 [Candidatus Limnocylindria bacterium]|nr:hypothetical protein [Candidatus Limnocylindria bacterium]